MRTLYILPPLLFRFSPFNIVYINVLNFYSKLQLFGGINLRVFSPLLNFYPKTTSGQCSNYKLFPLIEEKQNKTKKKQKKKKQNKKQKTKNKNKNKKNKPKTKTKTKQKQKQKQKQKKKKKKKQHHSSRR